MKSGNLKYSVLRLGGRFDKGECEGRLCKTISGNYTVVRATDPWVSVDAFMAALARGDAHSARMYANLVRTGGNR